MPAKKDTLDVRRIRENRKWTQEQLAVALGVSLNTVLAWETGSGKPAPRYARVLRKLDNKVA
jgi:DNA-binding transcriptional regulator YiaG